MAQPWLHNTEEEKSEAAHTYRRSYYARQRDKLHTPKQKNCKKGRQYDSDTALMPVVGRPRLYNTPEEKLEARHSSRWAYYKRNRDEICAKRQEKYQEKSKLKEYVALLAVEVVSNYAHLQVLISSSSTANFVKGLCTYFISNPDNPDSLDIMRGAIDALEDLRRCAQSVVDSDQQAFVLTYQEKFLECKKNGNYTGFWLPFFEKWEESWPIILKDVPLDPKAELEEIGKAREALQMRLIVKLRNNFGNSKVGHWANTTGNTIVNKLIGNITIKSGKKKSHSLDATEVYAKKYYATHVQPAVKEELEAMKDAPDTPAPKKWAMQVVRKQLASCWENETAEVKEEVTKLAQEMKEEREKDINHKMKELSKDLIISRLTEILLTFFTELHDATGWTFSILLAGPDPMNAGKLNVSSLHIGTTTAGSQFNHIFPNFKERIMVPYFEFASWVFPDRDVANAAVLLSKATTPDTLTPLPSPSEPSPALLGQEIPPNDTSLANTHNGFTYSPMDIAPDTSLTSVSSTSTLMYVTPNTSLALLGPLPSLSELSPALLGQEIPHTDTSLTHIPEPAYNFFQYSPTDPQDDSTDLDSNRTILPMPPNYQPPSPLPPSSPLLSSLPSLLFSPLPSVSRIGHDILFPDVLSFNFVNSYSRGFDNTTLESLRSPPRLHHLLSTQQTPAAYGSTPTPMAVPALAPAAIPTPAQTPTLAETPAQREPSAAVPNPLTPIHPVAPIAAPLSPAQMSSSACPGETAGVSGALPVVATKASKCKSMKTNVESSETVQAKPQKRGGAEVASNENSQPVEGGRGKQQQFQLSQAAAANAIGTS
ncbi:uncharacterized protein EDB91DRAFT_1080976 [Suillus paluster]|uniref:uncharacterized protein n=1 Tax=Suillus paluster TaxID=48578 RepID=UPI001B85BB1B|nr:uncharacterized protein EDB91DRAFT_1080976 [Suillus paluster]KAG1743571.1 hypothetical protein EDB91DRAFT_1080976 [Suillus paluster]